jgi:hypothetical protein
MHPKDMNMNAKQLIAVASLTIAATGAFAGDYTPFPAEQGSALSRAAVAAQARSAVAAGQVEAGDEAVVSFQGRSEQQRAVVRATAAQANRQGQLPVGELLSFEQRVAAVRS